MLSYGDDANPGNVSAPVIVGNDDWLAFTFLFAGQNLAGENRIYAVNQAGNYCPMWTTPFPAMSRPR